MKALCLAGAITFGISGCALVRTGPPPGALQCTGSGVCQVVVSVAGCKVSVDYDIVWVGGAQDVKIHWLISDPGDYSFADDGVFIKTPTTQFSKVPTGNKKLFILNDKKTQGGQFYYGVQVHDDKNNVDCPVLDPVIINEM
jgi:hypothetical protein